MKTTYNITKGSFIGHFFKTYSDNDIIAGSGQKEEGYMLKFLSVSRRILLAGIISLVLILLFSFLHVPVPALNVPALFGTYYTYFALISPILGLIFWLISTFYIRKNGQSAAYQQQLPFGNTMMQILKSDLSSPFRLIADQFTSKKKLIDYYGQIADTEVAKMLAAGSKALNREKLLRTIIRFAIYIIGVISAVNNFSHFKFPFF